jgi:hypothetical protein
MAIDERRRLELAEAAKRSLGDDAGVTLMEYLPPVGWADVATKRDLDVLAVAMRRDSTRLASNLESRLMADLHREPTRRRGGSSRS